MEVNNETSQLVDRIEFGRRAKAARILAGCETVKAAVVHLRDVTGVQFSERTLYALERGEAVLTVEHYFAVLIGYDAPGGLAYWEACYAAPVLQLIRKRIADGTR